MVGRIAARVLASVAIIAVGVAVYLIVNATVGKSDHTVTQTHSAHHSRGHHHKNHHHAKAKVYVVQPGDTMSEIAQKTHVPLTRLEALNPRVSPSALQTGTHLRLSR